MRDCLGKRAVIAQEQKPLAFGIEAPDMGQNPGIARDQVIDRRLAALRLAGTQAAGWFVKNKVTRLCGPDHASTRHDRVTRINHRSQFAHGAAIDPNAATENNLLAGTT